MLGVARFIGRHLAAYLTRPRPGYKRHDTVSVDQIMATLQPGDIILVDGSSRISTAIKYLTQSSWSHAALFVGSDGNDVEAPSMVEADLNEGVNLVPLSKYAEYNLRICRPVGLSGDDCRAVIEFARERVGYHYDLKNIVDLMRYLIQNPVVPVRYRRRLITLGSGEPTRAICSTLIAQAYQSIQYPILPLNSETEDGSIVLQKRHFTHFVPRDFDVSPYFRIVKPTLERGFDFRQLEWVGRREGRFSER